MSTYYCKSCQNDTYSYIDNNGINVDFPLQPYKTNIGLGLWGGFNSYVTDLIKTSDGKFIVVGFFDIYDSTSITRNIIRLNSDFSIDITFSPEEFGPNFNILNSVATQSDNKIVVGGFFNSYSGISIGDDIIRLNSDGSIDNTFNTGAGFDSDVLDVKVTSDDKIFVGGTFTSYSGVPINGLIKLNNDGTQDFTFGSGIGFYDGPGDGVVGVIAIQNDGKILVSGGFDQYDFIPIDYGFVRLDSGGTIDSTFSTGGGFLWQSGNTYPYCLEVQQDGKILVGGSFDEYSGTSVGQGLIRLESDGSIDTSFNIGSGFYGEVYTVKLQSDGKILVGGNFSSFDGSPITNNLVRLNSDGSLDETFDIGFGFKTNPNSFPTVSKIISITNEKLLVGGLFSSFNNYIQFNLVDIDLTTPTDVVYTKKRQSCFIPQKLGVGNLDVSVFDNLPYLGLQIQSTLKLGDGSIILGGQFNNYFGSGFSQTQILKINSDGSIDTNFSIYNAAIPGQFVYDLVQDSPNTFIAVGSFTNYSGISSLDVIVRLYTDGTVDQTFTPPSTLNLPEGYAVTVQQDGKILVGGNGINSFVRLNSDGSVDIAKSFPSGSYVDDIEVLPDGKIMLGGSFSSFEGYPVGNILRLNSDCSYDNTFYSGPLGFNGRVRTIKQNNNKYLVGGDFTGYSGGTITNLNTGFDFNGFNATINSIALLSDNSLLTGQSSFVYKLFTTGTVFQFYSINGNALKVKELGNGDILLGGTFTIANSVTGNTRLTMIDSDFAPVTSFSTGPGFDNSVLTFDEQEDGKIVVGGQFTFFSGEQLDTNYFYGTGFNNSIRKIREQSDQKLLIGGNFTTFNGEIQKGITRLNVDGTRDTSFDIGTGFTNSSIVYDIDIQTGGTITVVGTFVQYSGISANRIIRLNSDGSRDSTFNYGVGFNSTVFSVIKQPDGKLLCGGNFTTYSGITANRLIRLNSDGSRDITFSVLTGFGTSATNFVLGLQNDGKIIAGGSFTTFNSITTNRIVRLNSNGTRDNTFSIGTGFSSTVQVIRIQNDGKILVGGDFISYSGVPANRIIRLNTDGTVDTSFQTGTGFTTTVNSIEITPSGQILVGGNFTSYSGIAQNRIILLNSDGSVDQNFLNRYGANSSVLTTLPKSNSVFIGGNFSSFSNIGVNYFAKISYTSIPSLSKNRIIRLNPNGTNDDTFNIGTGFSSTVNAVKIQPDQKILVGGEFTTYSGVGENRIVRLNSDGSIDQTFQTGLGFDNIVYSIDLQDDNKILVGGDFISYSGVPANRIIRLNTDGTVDSSFQTGTGFDNSVRTTTTGPDGEIYVGGSFLLYSGISSPRIARLNSDGSFDSTFNVGLGFNNSVLDLVLLENSLLTVGGSFTTYKAVSCDRIVQMFTETGLVPCQRFIALNEDGSAVSGVDFSSGFTNSVYDIETQQDGKILLGGTFTGYSGTIINNLVRLNTDYTLDEDFRYGLGIFNWDTGQSQSVVSIEPVDGNKFLIAGEFYSYDVKYTGQMMEIFEDYPTTKIATLTFSGCDVCDDYAFSFSANSTYLECIVCNSGTTITTINPPHPVYTTQYGEAVRQLDAVQLGGETGLNN